jgi:hypothetical protein
MRIGISGTHGTGKTTLAEALCERLPGHVTTDDAEREAATPALKPALASLSLLVITVITPETERLLPTPELPGLREAMNEALLELVYADPLDAWADLPVLELDGPLDARLPTVLAALGPHPRADDREPKDR